VALLRGAAVAAPTARLPGPPGEAPTLRVPDSPLLHTPSSPCSFFNPCPVHKDFRKSEATLFCVDCDANPGGAAMCQHCVPCHGGHRTIQIRRYVYCDVVRAADIAPFVDIAGVQTYTINQAKVVFLNHRPQAKLLHAGAPDGCAVCSRALREGCAYCSLACKVEALVREGRLGPSAAGGDAAMAPAAPAAAPTGCCADTAPFGTPLDAAAVAAMLAAAAVAAPAAPSESSDCCTCDSAAGGGGRGAPAAPHRSSSSGNSDPHALGRRVSGSSSGGAWVAKRSSDSSCQSHLEWHDANGHVCRRKQALPRRSPLL
jgi:hypothetical protein